MTASILWFTSLGYGATRLSGLFARPVAWKWIDGITGTTMLALSASVAAG
jgi:L-lysine exporter family protein LysE/ArgO